MELKLSSKKQLHWVDWGKTIAIYLVILGHVPSIFNGWINSFHMAFFFFISGVLFYSRDESFWDFLKRRWRTLVIPYLFFNVVTYIFWYFLGRKFGNDAGTSIALLDSIIGVFFGNAQFPYLQHCGALWFLTALFSTELLYKIFFERFSIKIRIILTMVFVFVGWSVAKFLPFRLPWGFDSAMSAVVFYSCGNLIKPYFTELKKVKFLYLIPVTVLLLLASIYGRRWLNNIDFRRDVFQGGTPLDFVQPFIAIGFLVSFSILLQKLFTNNKLVKFYSFSTLIILALHKMGFSFIKSITYFIFKLPVDFIHSNTVYSVLFSFVNLAIMAVPIIILSRWFPFLIGRRKNELK